MNGRETFARRKIRNAVEARGYTAHDLEWEPWGHAVEKEGIPGGWTLRVDPDPSPPGSSGMDWFGGLSWRETVESIERFLPLRLDTAHDCSQHTVTGGEGTSYCAECERAARGQA